MNFFSLFKRKLIYKFKTKTLIDTQNFQDKSLDELLNFYGSDKANIFSKKNIKGHGFSKFYTKHLDKFKNDQLNILEIGSFAGASAAAFVKYFPNSNVFCFDVNISNFEYLSKKIHVYGIDINNEKKVEQAIKNIFLQNKFKNFDLIVDDGSHNLSDILLSLNFFFKFLKDKGLYVIEDYKYPNYFEYNRNTDDILIDKLLDNLKKKNFFKSKFFTKNDQINLMNLIDKIYTYRGNLRESDICFIKKN